MTKGTEIIVAIEGCLDAGIRDKQQIYNMVTQQLNVPRPTVRRVARTLRVLYLERISILQDVSVKPYD